MGRDVSPLGRAAKETDNELVRALALGRELICDALRILRTPYALLAKGAKTQKMLPEGIKHAIGNVRELSRIATDVGPAESR